MGRDYINVDTVELTRDMETDPEGVDRFNLAIGVAAIFIISALGALFGHGVITFIQWAAS